MVVLFTCVCWARCDGSDGLERAVVGWLLCVSHLWCGLGSCVYFV